MKVFCVIPAWNEEKNIEKIINQVKPKVDTLIIVDDGSWDNTFNLAKKHKDIIALRHIINRGQGAALQTGNDYALKKGADLIVHFDADGQFLAREIEEVVNPILNGEADVVFGSRFLDKKSDIPKLKKTIIIPLARIVNSLVLGVNLSDPQSGFRALSQKAAQKITIRQDDMAHCSEIIYKTFKYKFKVKEVPITVIYNEFGQSFKGGVKIFKDLLLSKLID